MVCHHGNVDPDKIQDAKRISGKAVSSGLSSVFMISLFMEEVIEQANISIAWNIYTTDNYWFQ